MASSVLSMSLSASLASKSKVFSSKTNKSISNRKVSKITTTVRATGTMVDDKTGIKKMRDGIKEAADENLLTPRFYTTDFDEMEQLFSTEINPNLDESEIFSILNEFRDDFNQKHFVRNDEFKAAADGIQGEQRRIFIEFLERSCTAEFSGFLLYKELGRRLKKTAPTFIMYATYLSEKIGYWRYISIYRHLQANPDDQLYPIFKYFENWCQDENRHGDFFSAILKARPEFLNDTEAKLWSRFFCLSVYVTMYLNDHSRSEFYESLGMDTTKFNMHVIHQTNKTTATIFPQVIDTYNPAFKAGLEACWRRTKRWLPSPSRTTLTSPRLWPRRRCWLLLPPSW
ncbi:unnamed protein product [Bathycoccus prasinos]